jgi:hypothetical protein
MRRFPVWAAALLLVGCVGPARTFSAYQGKAASAADEMRSSVATALLAVRVAQADHAFLPYISVTIADAERDASGIQGAFDSIQPPDRQSDELRNELDALLGTAVDAISNLRIAARRGEVATLVQIAAPLDHLSHQLDEFSKAGS